MILAIDTALAATSACLLVPGEAEPLASDTLSAQGSQAEGLMPLLDRIVAHSPDGFRSLTRVAVSIGPGSFTGIRIGVAAARGIGLACKVPVVGVSTLAALAAPAITAKAGAPIVAAIDARHGSVYVQSFGTAGETLFGPVHMAVAEAGRAFGSGPLVLVGSGAPLIAVAARAAGIAAEVRQDSQIPDIGFVALLGGLADPNQAQPRPLYLKPPDAKPSSAVSLLRAT